MTRLFRACFSKRVALLMGVALFFFLFVFLGVWQLNRLAWKNHLIAKVEQRAYAPPREILSGEDLLSFKPEDAEYLSVLLTGRFDEKHQVYVAASTKLGQGFWLMMPFQLLHGGFVWVNRGFVQALSHSSASESLSVDAPLQLSGLLRLSEPKGFLFRSNDPFENRWYSRDVAQFNAAAHLEGPPLYFVDAFVEPYPAGDKQVVVLPKLNRKPLMDETGEARLSREPIVRPVPGLTVLVFRNNHLAYACTWFALALLSGGILFWLLRHHSEPS